jgi:hypothetical protein
MILYPIMLAGVIVLTKKHTGVGLFDLLYAQREIVAAVSCMVGVVLFVRWQLDDPAQAWLRLLVAIVAGAVTYVGYLLIVARSLVGDLKRLLREVRGNGNAC